MIFCTNQCFLLYLTTLLKLSWEFKCWTNKITSVTSFFSDRIFFLLVLKIQTDAGRACHQVQQFQVSYFPFDLPFALRSLISKLVSPDLESTFRSGIHRFIIVRIVNGTRFPRFEIQ
jgi:hypothetical protein